MSLELARTSPHAEGSEGLAGVLPAAPRALADTGLSDQFVLELAAKVLLLRGRQRLTELAHALRLPASVVEELLEFMRGERLVEPLWRWCDAWRCAIGADGAGPRLSDDFLRRRRDAAAPSRSRQTSRRR